MSLSSDQYHLPEAAGFADTLKRFEALGEVRIAPPERVRRTYFDTFDWRLYRAGGILVEEVEPYEVRTIWQKSGDGRVLALAMMEVPRFGWDIPPGSLREALEPLLEMRSLLPMAMVNIQRHRAALINRQGKTVLRLAIETVDIPVSGNQDIQRLPARLLLEPLKGYRKPLLQARALVGDTLRLEPAEPLFLEILSVTGQEAGDYTGKLQVDLTPELPAGEAMRRILLDLLETMQSNLEGVRADLDSEFLHDFRVAVRRTRSALSQVKGVLPLTALARFRPGFKWLGQITGPTRDLDVYLLKFPAYRDTLPQSLQESLQPLHDFLATHQKQEHRKLARSLETVRFRSLMEDWRAFLGQDWIPNEWPARAGQPIGVLANKQLWKTYRLAMQEGMAIREDSPPEALHQLRITCKKLRYLMEFFAGLYPKKLIRSQIKALKALQDNLGDFHDLEVQADSLRQIGSQMQTEKKNLPGETLMAMGVLIDSLQRRQLLERRAFAERFARFARPGNQKLCRKLFKG